MTDILLQDNFQKNGTDLKEFFDTLDELDKITGFIPLASQDIQLITVESVEDDKLIVTLHCQDGRPKRQCLSITALREKGASEELIQEAIEQTKLMLLVNRKLYFTSASLLTTLSLRVNLAGFRFFTPTKARNAYITETMHDVPFQTKMMCRNDGSLKKVFAMHSPRYGQVPQSILRKTIKTLSDAGLGKCECKDWSVSHSISQIHLNFPEKAKDLSLLYGLPDTIIPGLYLATSDTGDCSVTAKGTWTVGNMPCYTEVYKRKHTKNIDTDDLLENIEKQIFAKYTLVPEKLCELLLVDIENPAEAYKSIFKQIGMTKAVGKKISDKLYEELCAEIDSTISYTAYNIAVSIMGLPERCCGLSVSAKNNLADIAINAVFAKYKDDSAEEVDDIYLTA